MIRLFVTALSFGTQRGLRVDIEALDQDIDLVNDHPRHALDLRLQTMAQGDHGLLDRMSIGEDNLQ